MDVPPRRKSHSLRRQVRELNRQASLIKFPRHVARVVPEISNFIASLSQEIAVLINHPIVRKLLIPTRQLSAFARVIVAHCGLEGRDLPKHTAVVQMFGRAISWRTVGSSVTITRIACAKGGIGKKRWGDPPR